MSDFNTIRQEDIISSETDATVESVFENVVTNFNPLENDIKTLEVQEKSVTNYLNQIRQNIYLGKKAMFVVCRDLYDAKLNLKNKVDSTNQNEIDYYEYDDLLKQLGISRTTAIKFESIGKCLPLRKLFTEGRLPFSWTTLYQLSKLSKDDYDKIESIISHKVTMTEVNKKLGIESNTQSILTFPFGEMKIDKKTGLDELAKYQKIMTDALQQMPNVSFEMSDKVENNIVKQISKQEKESKSERTDNTISKEEVA